MQATPKQASVPLDNDLRLSNGDETTCDFQTCPD